MRIKFLLKSLAPLFLILFIFVITYFAAFAISVLIGDVKVSDANTALVNEGIYNLLRFSTSLFAFSYWYLIIVRNNPGEGIFGKIPSYDNNEISSSDRSFLEEIAFNSLKGAGKSFKGLLRPLKVICFILLGLSIQVATDSAIYILSSVFKDSFASYTRMIEGIKGTSSLLYIITVITIGPLVEEIVFRGIIMHYALKIEPEEKNYRIPAAILLQALLFGIYHGNIIQFVYAFIFAILFAVIDLRYNSLVPSILLHIIVNGSLYIIGRKMFINTPFTVLILIISIFVLVLTYIYLYRAQEDEKR